MNKLISEINTNPTRDAITATIEALLIMEAKSATKFISPTLTIRASQKLYHGKLPPKNATSLDIVLFGRPMGFMMGANSTTASIRKIQRLSILKNFSSFSLSIAVSPYPCIVFRCRR